MSPTPTPHPTPTTVHTPSSCFLSLAAEAVAARIDAIVAQSQELSARLATLDHEVSKDRAYLSKTELRAARGGGGGARGGGGGGAGGSGSEEVAGGLAEMADAFRPA